MKLHQKGFLLVELSRSTSMWDQELVHRALREYGLAGRYWENALRIALDELAAAGLITRLEQKLESIGGRPTLMFLYEVSKFGHSRMLETGLLTAGGRR
jgi:hypothetical protein